MDVPTEINKDLVHLSRLALSSRLQDVNAFVRRLTRKYRKPAPELAHQLAQLLDDRLTRQSPMRGGEVATIPVDTDTRLQLLRHENPPILEHAPILPPELSRQIEQVIAEHARAGELLKSGLAPTRTAIFTGPPGVGKTMAARWLADRMNRPLLALDLSAVMSSFLGRTGANVRHVLDYAKGVECVLLLDELDAIAKRRDDAHEVGELKRLVTVLLQEIDDWPAGGLLIAASNHSELLDPAVWRRFEVKLDFPMPDETALNASLKLFLGAERCAAEELVGILATLYAGFSFSDIEREIVSARRESVIEGHPLDAIVIGLARKHAHRLPMKAKRTLAAHLSEAGVSQRQIREITGLSRDFIRKWSARLENSKAN